MRTLSKSFLSIIAFIIFMSSCRQGLYIQDNFLTLVYKCMYEQGYTATTLRITSTQGGINLQKIIQKTSIMRNAGMDVDIIYEPCRSTNAAEEIANFVNKIPRDLYDRVWLVIDGGGSGKCQWMAEPKYFESNCQAYYQYLLQFEKYKIITGVFTNSYVWSLYMFNCNKLGNSPLFWGPGYYDNPDRFSPFGGWMKYAMKQIPQKVNVCGYSTEPYIYE